MLAAAIFHAYAPITVPIVTATTATGEREFEIPRFFQEEKDPLEILFTARYSLHAALFISRKERTKGKRGKRAKKARNAEEERERERKALTRERIACRFIKISSRAIREFTEVRGPLSCETMFSN